MDTTGRKTLYCDADVKATHDKADAERVVSLLSWKEPVLGLARKVIGRERIDEMARSVREKSMSTDDVRSETARALIENSDELFVHDERLGRR